MEIIKSSSGSAGLGWHAILRRTLAAAAVVVSTAGCTKEPEAVAISATTHNYSQDDLIRVVVNGKEAGSLLDPAKVGEVKGGGVICCITLSRASKKIEVQIRAADRVEVVRTYTVQAKLRQPWPKIASYAVFNVLPGQRVLIEVVPTYLIPEGSRLQELEKAWKEIE